MKNNWPNHHKPPTPVAILCAAAFVFGIILIGIDAWPKFRLPLAIVLAVYLVISVRIIATGLVIAALLFTPPQSRAVGPTVTVVVIIAGGTATVALYKYCKRKFPPVPRCKSNDVALAESDIATASVFTYWDFTGYCIDEPPGPYPDLTTSITLQLEDDTLAITDYTCSTATASGEKFIEALRSYGADLPDGTGARFGANGLPVPASTVTFDAARKAPRIAQGVRLVKVESSVDLREWAEVARVIVPDGYPIRIMDTSAGGQVFYRVKAE